MASSTSNVEGSVSFLKRLEISSQERKYIISGFKSSPSCQQHRNHPGMTFSTCNVEGSPSSLDLL
jgi:hypothetical protein